MQEELKVKLTLDDSDFNSGIEKGTSKLKNFGKAGGASLGMSAEAAEQLHDSLDSIRGLNFATLLTGISGMTDQFRTWRKTLPDYKDMVKGAKEFLDKNSAIYKDIPWEGPAEAQKNYNLHMKEANSLITEGTGLFGAFTAGAMASVVAVAAVVAQVALLVIQIRNAIRTAQQIKQINAEAAKIGMSVQAYQQWGYVLESVGVEANELTSLIKTLSDEQAQMAEGSEGASKAFEKLGLSIADVTAMNQEQLFVETITRLQGVENAVERTKLAYQIFGEDAAHVANVMNMSNEQMRALINNYNELGGGASQALVDKSQALSFSIGQLKQAWTGLSNALAEVFMPAITAVVNWLTKAIAIIRMFVQTIFGLDASPASSSGSNMASGMSSYAKATNGATKAVQKLKREQMGFDELNKLPGKDSSSGSGSGIGDLDLGGGGLGGGGFSLPEVADLGLGKWREWFDKYKTLIQDITTWSLLGIGVLGAVLCFMGGNWLGGIAFLGMAGLGLAVGSVEGGTFERLFTAIKNWWNGIKQWFTTYVAPVFTKQFWVEKWENVKAATQEKIDAIKQAISTKWQGIKDWFGQNVAPKFTKQYWLDKTEPIRTAISEKIDAVKTAFSTKWAEIKDWFNKNVAPKFTKQYWLDKLDTLRAGAKEKLDAVKKQFSDAWTNIKNTFSGWGSFFTGLWDKVSKTFKSVGTTIGNAVAGAVKSVINSVLTAIENKINSFINMLNNAITIINKIPGVNISRLSKVSIPKLATGGIATRSTLANIGENGAEAVLPLERNTQWMDALADKIASRGNGASKIVLMVDGKELGWASINGINSITKQTGNLQLQLV